MPGPRAGLAGNKIGGRDVLNGVQLIGRGRELEAVERAVADVRGGASRVLGVSGVAGLGKSALLEQVAEHARAAGFMLVEGRGVEHERNVPFGVALAAFEPHAALEPVASSPAERFQVHRAQRALLERLGREQPVALLLDDLHWADEASLELVLHLLRRPPAVAHLLVFATRSGGPAARLFAPPATPGLGAARARAARATPTRWSCSPRSPTRPSVSGSRARPGQSALPARARTAL